jgi:hypothetical protein
MLVFELRKDGNGNYFVRAVYNGNQISLPVLEPATNGLYDLPNMTQYVLSSFLVESMHFCYFIAAAVTWPKTSLPAPSNLLSKSRFEHGHFR